jgi:hypothetical protein
MDRPGRVTQQIRREVTERAAGLCEYCRCPDLYGTQAFSVEHIHPRSLEGTNDPDNLALSCQGCNNHKFTRIQAPDPDTGEVVILFHPRQQKWAEHFAWADGGIRVVGTTPTGRATVELLQLNRERVVNLRRVLIVVGEHPPRDA